MLSVQCDESSMAHSTHRVIRQVHISTIPLSICSGRYPNHLPSQVPEEEEEEEGE
jgi:hypothetical protein